MATLLSDTFTGTTGAALTAHTMDTGPGWANVNAFGTVENFLIQSNRVKNTPASGVSEPALANAGQADVTAQVTVYAGANSATFGNPGSGLAFNFTPDATNNGGDTGWYLSLVGGTGNNTDLVLFRYDGFGSITEVARTTAVLTAHMANGESHVLKVVTSGNAVTGFVDGVQKLSQTISNRQYKTGTYFGLVLEDYSSYLWTMDDFSVTSSASVVTGSGAASFTVSAAGSGQSAAQGHGTPSFTFTGAGSGRSDAQGHGTATASFSAASSGQSAATGSGAASAAFTAAAEGAADATSSGTASLEFDAAASGSVETSSVGSGAATFSCAAVGAGACDATGSGAASVSFAAAAVSIVEVMPLLLMSGGGSLPAKRKKRRPDDEELLLILDAL